jgi:hypothetical protein
VTNTDDQAIFHDTRSSAFAAIQRLEASGAPREQAETFIQILWEVRATARSYGVYNAIAAMRRLEAAGFPRSHAEVIAEAFVDAFAEAKTYAQCRVDFSSSAPVRL